MSVFFFFWSWTGTSGRPAFSLFLFCLFLRVVFSVFFSCDIIIENHGLLPGAGKDYIDRLVRSSVCVWLVLISYAPLPGLSYVLVIATVTN